MPSPFPGMDPYIEDPFYWSDFHATTMVAMREAVNGILPKNYVAAVERHVWIEEHEPGEISVLGFPDVQVTDRAGEAEKEPAATGLLSISAPAIATLPLVKKPGNRFLRIVDRHDRRVVTVIELLSPSNKTLGGDGVAYRAKRSDYLAAVLNLVEIDLLRSGVRPPLEDPAPPPSDYYILVSTPASYPKVAYWPVSVRDPLPMVPIPLDPPEQPVFLNLRACLDRVYDGGRYFDEIDYSMPPYLPLSETNTEWALALLANRAT